MPVRRLEIILLSLIFLTPGLVFAEPARDVLIKKQLDCVDRQLAAGSDQLQWVDICYSDEMQKLHASGEGDTLKQLTEDMMRDKEMAQIYKNAERSQPLPAEPEFEDPQLRELIEQDQPREFLAEDVAPIVAEVTQDRAGLIYKEPGVLIRSHLDLSVGYRQDDLNWNIAGDTSGNNPNILSELTWSDLDIPIVKLSGNAVLWEHLVIDGMYDHGKIIDGDNQDSDYLGDNRTSEFSRSNNGVDQDDVWDVSAAMGYRMYYGADWGNFGVDDLWITALGGYSYHEQNLFIIDGNQTIPVSSAGPFSGLRSEYNSEWKGPWAGLEFAGTRKSLSGFFRFEYHWADYYAEANWNLRTDFIHPKSFEHIADGRGLVFRMGFDYKFNDHWAVNFSSDIQDWKTDAGIDRTFFAVGSVGETRLNEVNWDSISGMFGAKYSFN